MSRHDILEVEGQDNSKETGTYVCDPTWGGHVKTRVVDQLGEIVRDAWVLMWVRFLLGLTAGRRCKKATSVVEDMTGKIRSLAPGRFDTEGWNAGTPLMN